MSFGYGGIAKLVAKDNNYLLYQYSVINYNAIPPITGKIYDGEIWLNNSCFIEFSEDVIITKKKHGKRIIQRKTSDIPIEYYIENKLIEIVNSKLSFKISENGIDYFAIRLCEFILEEYQIKDKIPEKISFYY